MNITTETGEEIDVSEWLDQMRENHRLGRDVLEQTPIGKTAAGGYFWFDEDQNPKLLKRSVSNLIRKIVKEPC